jgi:hypothetical protein
MEGRRERRCRKREGRGDREAGGGGRRERREERRERK